MYCVLSYNMQICLQFLPPVIVRTINEGLFYWGGGVKSISVYTISVTWKMLYLMSQISTSLLGLPSGPKDASRDLNLKTNIVIKKPLKIFLKDRCV